MNSEREFDTCYALKRGALSYATTLHGKAKHGVYTHPAGMVEVWHSASQVNLRIVFKGLIYRRDLFPSQPLTPRQVANRARKFLLEITNQ